MKPIDDKLRYDKKLAKKNRQYPEYKGYVALIQAGQGSAILGKSADNEVAKGMIRDVKALFSESFLSISQQQELAAKTQALADAGFNPFGDD